MVFEVATSQPQPTRIYTLIMDTVIVTRAIVTRLIGLGELALSKWSH